MLKFFRKEKKQVTPLIDLSKLPNDILLHILSLVDDDRSIRRCLCVSKSWNQVGSSNLFWQTRCITRQFDPEFLAKELKHYFDTEKHPWKKIYATVRNDPTLRLHALYGDYFVDSTDAIWGTSMNSEDVPKLSKATHKGYAF